MRGSDNNSTVDIGFLEHLNKGNVLVAGSRWGVNDEIIELAPVDVSEELLDESSFADSPPNNCVVFVFKHEAYAHDAKILLNVNGAPACVTHADFLARNTEHMGCTGAADVYIEQTDIEGMVETEAEAELGGDRAFANTTLARKNEELVANGALQATGDGGDVGVWGGVGGDTRGAGGLVGAAHARVSLARRLR